MSEIAINFSRLELFHFKTEQWMFRALHRWMSFNVPLRRLGAIRPFVQTSPSYPSYRVKDIFSEHKWGFINVRYLLGDDLTTIRRNDRRRHDNRLRAEYVSIIRCVPLIGEAAVIIDAKVQFDSPIPFKGTEKVQNQQKYYPPPFPTAAFLLQITVLVLLTAAAGARIIA